MMMGIKVMERPSDITSKRRGKVVTRMYRFSTWRKMIYRTTGIKETLPGQSSGEFPAWLLHRNKAKRSPINISMPLNVERDF